MGCYGSLAVDTAREMSVVNSPALISIRLYVIKPRILYQSKRIQDVYQHVYANGNGDRVNTNVSVYV